MPYQQITLEERYQLAQLRALGLRPAVIARRLGWHRSKIHRELQRNPSRRGRYEWYHAHCGQR